MKADVIVLKKREWWKEEREPSEKIIITTKRKVEDKYYTVKTVAAILDCSIGIIYAAIASGKLPVQPLGRTYRISRSDLETYLNNEAKRKLG